MAVAQVPAPSISRIGATVDAAAIEPEAAVDRGLSRLTNGSVERSSGGPSRGPSWSSCSVAASRCWRVSGSARRSASVLFTAFWGGPGFGGMMGATVYFSQHLEDF